jgi:hypothetical protein
VHPKAARRSFDCRPAPTPTRQHVSYGSTPVIENCEPNLRFGSETGHWAWPLIAMSCVMR